MSTPYHSWCLSPITSDSEQWNPYQEQRTPYPLCSEEYWEQICQGGFKAEWMLMDGQLETLRGDIANLGIHLYEMAEDEHVGEVEQYVRVIKG